MTYAEALTAVSNIGSEETPADQFLPVELKVAALLLLFWTNKVEGSGIIDGLNSAAESNRPSDVNIFLTDQNSEFSSTVNSSDEREALLSLLRDTAITGAGIVSSKGSILNSSNAAKIIALLNDQMRWFTNSYFGRIVTPAINAAVQQNVTSLSQIDLKTAIQSTVKRTIKNTAPYWRMTANGTVGRSHHYGLLVGSRDRDIYMQKWVSVLDDRTSAICEYLSGRLFYTSRGISELEKQANLPPAVFLGNSIWPLKVSDVEGFTPEELARTGICAPVHPNCRSSFSPVKS